MIPQDWINDFPLSRHFNLRDFQEPHTMKVKIWRPFVEKLDAVCELLKAPLIIISGYRTAEYNSTLPDAVPNSAHIYGLAADVRSNTRWHNQIAVAARKVGIPRIKIYPPSMVHARGWVHLGYNDYKI